MAVKTAKRQFGNYDKNPIEAVGGAVVDITKGVGDSLKHDLAEAAVSDLWKQLLGVEGAIQQKQKEEGDLMEGEEIVFSKRETKVEIRAEVEPGIDYVREILHAEKNIQRAENSELKAKVDEIMVELHKLSKSSKQLETAFKDVDMNVRTEKPGRYHLNFFEWMLVTVQNARMRIEESQAWVGVVSGKAAKRDYWSLTKSHGTSFSLSGERIVATQVG